MLPSRARAYIRKKCNASAFAGLVLIRGCSFFHHLEHLSHDRLHRRHEDLLLRGERAEDVVVLVGPVELLVRHPDAVARGLGVNHVEVARRLLPDGGEGTKKEEKKNDRIAKQARDRREA